MKITVDRSSVCMGDDAENHERTVELDGSADCLDLFNMLRGSGFFASVSGNNVVWVLTAGSVCVLAYYTRSGRVTKLIDKTRLAEICGMGKLKFLYYSSPEQWEAAARYKGFELN